MKAIVVPLTLAVVCAFAAGDSLHDQIVKSDHLIDKTLLGRDMKKFDAIMRPGVTADFRHVEMGQSITYDQMVEHMKSGLGMMKGVDVAKTTLVSLKITGEQATAETRHEIGGQIGGPGGKAHTMLMSGMTTDAYRREGSTWKLASMTWHDMKQLMDGKPLPMPPAKPSGRS
jgi:hypothetical protein